LREVLQARVFAPLGLHRTFVAETLVDNEVLTPGYSAFLTSGALREDIAPRYHPGWVAHGVVISTAPEIALLIEALVTGKLLGKALLVEMLEPVLVPHEHSLFRQPAYGLGVMLDPASPHGLVVGHGGGGPGYSTGAIHLPDITGHRVTSIALVNSDHGDLGLPMAFALAETVI
jgi:D-alanyl-D-alanine carboxypeptidase